MKNYLFIFIALSLFSCGEGNEKKHEENKDRLSTSIVNNPRSAEGLDSVAWAEMPTLDFTDTVYNFGNIREGEVVVHEFEFTNNGKTPLIISSANAACGCTVPDYPHEPIAPGEKKAMVVKFNSDGKPGHQEKSVTIQANTREGTHFLYIKADVQKK